MCSCDDEKRSTAAATSSISEDEEIQVNNFFSKALARGRKGVYNDDRILRKGAVFTTINKNGDRAFCYVKERYHDESKVKFCYVTSKEFKEDTPTLRHLLSKLSVGGINSWK